MARFGDYPTVHVGDTTYGAQPGCCAEQPFGEGSARSGGFELMTVISPLTWAYICSRDWT